MKKQLKLLFIIILSIAIISKLPTAQDCGLLPPQLATQITQNEPWYCPINQQIYSQWVADLPAALAVVFLSFMIAGIIFMAGIALNNNKVKNFGIGEFYEAIVTAIIVVSFLYLCAVIFGIIPAVLVGNINPYATAFNLISTTITSAQNMYAAIYNVYFTISAATSFSISISGNFGVLTKALFSNVPQIIKSALTFPAQIFYLDPAQAIARFIVDGVTALYAEYYLMVFFSVAAIPVFLIPGVFFRAILPTRGFGGVLIAMAFGFYIIMPALFAVAFYFTAPSIQNNMATVTFQIQNLGAQNGIQNAVSPSSPLAVDLQGAKSALNGFWLLIFFYPGLIIAITYTTIREIANFIGRAPALIGRIRSFL